MAIDPLSAGLTLGGGALSAVSGLLGGSSEARAARQAEEARLKNTGYAEKAGVIGTLGPASAMFLSKLYEAQRQMVRTGDDSQLKALYAGPEYKAYVKESGGPAVGQLRMLADRFTKQDRETMAGYNADTARLDQESAGLSSLASQWGAGRDRIIDQDAAEGLRANNDLAMARLNAAGLGGSSVVANQLGENARQSQREVQRAKQDVSEARIDRTMGARQSGLGLLASRMNTGTGLRLNQTERAYGFRTAPISAASGAMNGVSNLWAGSPLAPQSATSGIGSALSGIGNSAAGLGSMLLMRDLFGGKAA